VLGSVRDAATLAALRAAIADRGWGSDRIDLVRPHLASARHADAVARAREALAAARATLDAGDALDLIAPELLTAVAALGEITGARATEAILDGVFARFCIGK
jgi:tRNA U34 5-carboxymethylaminomethyl modifying GTPase MnmE/TrmE